MEREGGIDGRRGRDGGRSRRRGRDRWKEI